LADLVPVVHPDAKLEASLEPVSANERQSAMLQMMLTMRERLAGLRGAASPLPQDAPPEVAAMNETLQQRMRELEQRAREKVAEHPLGPEILRQFGQINPEILRLFGTVLGPDADNQPDE
jgi:hypothetical protein